MRVFVPALLILGLAAPARAQDLDLSRANLPRSVTRHIEQVNANSSTRHYRGDTEIAAGETITVPVMMRDGVLRVSGTLRDELVVLRGDVVFEPGAVVEGSVTVVEGELRGEDNARIIGGWSVYGEGFSLESGDRRGQRRVDFDDRDDRDDDEDREWRWRGNGDADFMVNVAHNYNRVEGLPIRFGPDIRTGGRYSTRFQALGIWRTELGPVDETRHMGYVARIEQFFGGETLRAGVSMHSVIEPIEAAGLTDTEATIAAAVFHDDQRDYFEREGWSVYARIAQPGSPLDLRAEYRSEEHGSVAARTPWTLFNDDRAWRAQPRIGVGAIDLLTGTAAWDARRGENFETRGWMARAEVTRALDGTLSVARAGGAGFDDVAAEFTTGIIDLRRYERAGAGGILAMRIVGGGALDERALPPQYQHALGGPGSMPGLPLFSADCGARNALVVDEGDVFFPSYGCDRFGMLQVEYRGGFDVSFGHHHDDDDDDDGDGRHEHGWNNWHFDSDVDWTLFVDAARGWALQQERFGGRADTRNLYDVGAGIILGDIGIYGAVPLDDSTRGLRLFARLGPRF